MNSRTCISLIFLMMVLSPIPAQDNSQWEPKIIGILQDYKASLVDEPEGSLLSETSSIVSHILANNRYFYIDKSLTGIYSGMAFTRDADNSHFGLSFGEDFLSTYTTGSSPHLTVLAHELWHFRDFMKNRQAFLSQDSDPTEKVLFEMDALHVEADFVRKMKAADRELKSFERFMLASYDHDYLYSVVLYLKSESQHVIFDFMDRKRSYNKDGSDAEKELAAIVVIGTRYIDEYLKDRTIISHKNFVAYIDMVTFRKQLQRYIPYILNNSTMLWKEVFDLYPDIAAIYSNISKVEQEDQQKWSDYRNNVIQAWEKDAIAGAATP